jgi:hypothetical protein
VKGLRLRRSFGIFAKKRSASSMDMSGTSAIDRLEAHLERLAVVSRALARLARHVHVGQEVHLDLDLAVALHVSQRPPRTLNENRPGL